MDKQQQIALFCAAFLCVLAGTLALPSGAPESSCGSMVPSHPGSPITFNAPYRLRVSSSFYEPGGTIEVTLSGQDFRGFIVQARSGTGNDDNRLGMFEESSNDHKTICNDVAATHTDNVDKSSVTLTWRAPEDLSGNVVFRASVVQVYTVYYTEIFSAAVSDSPPPTTTTTTVPPTPSPATTTTTVPPTPSPATTTTIPPTPSPATTTRIPPTPSPATTTIIPPTSPTTSRTTTPTTSPRETTRSQTQAPSTPIDLSTCGTEKGCFRFPENCDIDTCTTVATWTPATGDDTSVLFELQGRGVGWVALGFSNDDMMGEDYVLMCARSSGAATITSTYNVVDTIHQNVPFDNEDFGIGGFSAGYEDGVVRCVFRREISAATVPAGSGDDLEQFYDIRDPFTLLLGYGPVLVGRPQLHTEIPQISESQVRVASDMTDLGTTDMQPTNSPTTRVISWFLSILYGFLELFGFGG